MQQQQEFYDQAYNEVYAAYYEPPRQQPQYLATYHAPPAPHFMPPPLPPPTVVLPAASAAEQEQQHAGHDPPPLPRRPSKRTERATISELLAAEEEPEVTAYIAVRSIDRDRDLFPSSARFLVQLQNELAGVRGAAVTQLRVPLTEPAVNSRNQALNFEVDGLGTFQAIVPTGSYNGRELAEELMLQMNLQLHGDQIDAATAFVDYNTRLVYTSATHETPQAVNVRVQHYPPRDMFTFQLVDAAAAPLAVPALRLFLTPATAGTPYYQQVNDIWDVLGFDRLRAMQVGTFDAGLGQWGIDSTVYTAAFGGGADRDERYTYALRSSMACRTRTEQYATLSIDALDKDDVLATVPPGTLRSALPISLLGTVYLPDASSTREPDADLANTTACVIAKRYAATSKQNNIKSFIAALYRPDGTLFDLNGAEWSCVVTVSYTANTANAASAVSKQYQTLVGGK